MKKLIMTMAAMTVGMTASADVYPYLSFETNEGEVVSVGVENLQMTFEDGKLMVSATDGTKEFAVADLSRMFFSATTAIKEIPVTTNHKKAVYSLSGTFLGSYATTDDIRTALGNGTYIVKDNNNATKIMAK